MQPQFEATPGKQGKGFKYAIIGCGCLGLLIIAALVIVFAAGGLAWLGLSGSPSSSGGTGAPLSTGGGVCDKTIACCKAMLAKTGGSQDTCDNFKNVPTAACEQALQTYKTTAPNLGVTCD
jgi:hypothetical protein